MKTKIKKLIRKKDLPQIDEVPKKKKLVKKGSIKDFHNESKNNNINVTNRKGIEDSKTSDYAFPKENDEDELK